nr:3-dehydroquinate synthase [Desulfobacterales bacterium]
MSGREMTLDKNIYLMGFMGSGKSRVGKILARKLGMRFIDTDEMVEEKAGKSISDIFTQDGEEAFRRLEHQCIVEASRSRYAVISLGGGAVTRPENWEVIRQGISLYLFASPETILERVRANDDRPLLSGLSDEGKLERIRSMLAYREKFYNMADIVIRNEKGDSPQRTAELAAEKVAMRASLKIVGVNLGQRSYPIYIGSGILSGFGDYYRRHGLGRKVAVVTDTTVSRLHLEPVEKSLNESGYNVTRVVIPDGEGQKSLKTCEEVCGVLIKAGLERSSSIVALGGGVVGDIAGFVAATFLRGVSYVQVPTSILAQADSSIGGKVAVNHPLGKNMIGAFYQPRFVFIDVDVLRTLPKHQITAGLAEVVKHALIRDEAFFRLLEEDIEAIIDLKAPTELLERVIERNCQIKAEVVSRDETEQGLRAILNYGHTIGHALEAVTNYCRYRHGEAVILGMIAAGRIACRKGMLGEDQLKQQNDLLQRIGRPKTPVDISTDSILKRMESDKKVRDGRVRFVLLEKIGKAVVTDEVEEPLVRAAIEEIKRG